MHIGWFAEACDLLVMLIGKTGTFLNARGRKISFILHGVVLCYWLWVDIERQLYAQALSAVIGLGLNIYGYYNWKKKGIGE